MGGELDSTNVIDPPEVAVICNLGLDHTEFLGNTLEEIAQAKAGIIKPGCSAVLYRGSPSVEAVFEEACKARGVELCKADFSALVSRSHSFAGLWFPESPGNPPPGGPSTAQCRRGADSGGLPDPPWLEHF